ncbi:MAG: peptidoglycan-associated lipoprotein Pal [Desulfohalobiaceae bacterium]|nr:peptidoglycan-associated lipoprotein Pal [Desulfohalobiaceae bacterium]
MTRQRKIKQIILLGMVLAALVLGSGCAKKQVDSQPSDLQAETAGEQAGETAMEREAAEEEALSEAEEYRLRQAEAAQREAEAEEESREAMREIIYFAFDSYELSPEAREALKEKAEVLENNPGIDLLIEGHCDERGTEEYNLALGERRARAAYEYLVLLGISPDRLSIISFGEEKPLDPGHTEEAWDKNRRAQFRITD